MEKILILYGSYGGGHKSAANAIKKYVENNYKDFSAEMVDCIEYINKTLNKLTISAYNKMAKSAPGLWKKVYFNSEKGFLSKISNGINALMAKKLLHLIEKENPTIIISTHPFSTQMCGILKRKGKINCKVATILTDFQIHNQWLQESKYIDKYFVSHSGMKKAMEEKNIDGAKIFVTGIPISEAFSKDFNKQEILKEFGLEENKKTILFFGGGAMGLGKERTCEILKVLAEDFKDFQIVAISGKNEAMNLEFKNIVKNSKSVDRIKVLEYTNQVPELMSVSNVVITKPGGLTSTESIVSNLPIIIINPIPGQEEQNAEFLEEKQIGVWLKKQDNIKEVLESVINSNEKLEQMRNNLKGFGNKQSTKDICEEILKK